MKNLNSRFLPLLTSASLLIRVRSTVIRKIAAFFSSVLLSLLAPPLLADESISIKPGLWEHTVKMESETGQLERAMEQVQQQMDAMPAAQKKMMLDMLKRQGMDLDFTNQTLRDCVTSEQANLGEFEWSNKGECEQVSVERNGDETHVKFACGKNNARGEMIIRDQTEYTGESQMTVDFQGQRETVSIAHGGEWLGDDCGDLN